jgi:hypothetical protein
MTKLLVVIAAIVWAGTVQAEEVVCRGNIISIQGEGLVNRTYRFEVDNVKGPDVMAVLEKCKAIARERQGRAARKNPSGNFRPFSDIDLQCVQGSEKFDVRRTLQTGP